MNIKQLTDLTAKQHVRIAELEAESKSLKEFAREVIGGYCWGLGGDELDGLEIQELAEKLKLITPCIALEVDDESDFEIGDKIYKFSEALKEQDNGK